METLLDALKLFTTPEISDALDSCGVEGALLHIKSLHTPVMKIVGPAYTIQYAANEQSDSDFKNAANYIDHVPPGAVVVIDNHGRLDCTVWGSLLTEIAQKNDIAGTVVFGAVRDVQAIRDLNYPLYCSAVYMRSGKNRVHKAQEQSPLLINNVVVNPNDVIVADDNGVVVIPQALVSVILQRVTAIRFTETQIQMAIKSGISLEEARERFRYDKPWLHSKS